MYISFIKGSFFQTISLTLTLLLIFNLFAIPIAQAEGNYIPAGTGNEESIKPYRGDLPRTLPNERLELKSKRTEYSTRYLNPDGTFTEEIYLEPTFYKDPSDKEWKKIDNDLLSSTKRPDWVENTANSFKVFFPNSSNNEILSIEKNGKQIDIIPVGAGKVNSNTKDNKITYKGIYPDVDIRYELQGNKVKEDIILNRYTGQNIFTFELKLKGYTAVQETDGIIYFIIMLLGQFISIIPKPSASIKVFRSQNSE